MLIWKLRWQCVRILFGKYVFDAFPDNPETPQVKSVKNLYASLQEVLRAKKPHQMVLQRYDEPRHRELGGGFEEKILASNKLACTGCARKCALHHP